jgi:hypothetical protein
MQLFLTQQLIRRSDGSVRLGELTKSLGLPWQNIWEVCVEADGANAGSCRAEEGANLGKPTMAGLSKLGLAPGQDAGVKVVTGTARAAPPKPAAAQQQAPVDPKKFLSTQRVGVSLNPRSSPVIFLLCAALRNAIDV